MRKTDIQLYRDFFLANGNELVSDPEHSDLVLIWTCAFRNDFRKNSIEQLAYYQNRFNAKVAAAGCLPDIDRNSLDGFSGLIINWRDDQAKLEEYFGAPKIKFKFLERILGEKNVCQDVEAYKKANPNSAVTFADQFLKLHISEGCRFKCSYCSERLAFPAYRSFDENQLVQTCQKLTNESGHRKLMLLGDSIGDYGHDIGRSLKTLIRKIIRTIPDINIALHGLNPAHFLHLIDEMREWLQQGYIGHLSLPIQSASDRILRLMKRPYNACDIERIFGFLNNIGFKFFETHIIIGFPGETEQDYHQTLAFIERHRPRYVLTSGFLEAPGAEASKLPCKIDKSTIRDRIITADKKIQSMGIICNSENGRLSSERFRSLNLI